MPPSLIFPSRYIISTFDDILNVSLVGVLVSVFDIQFLVEIVYLIYSGEEFNAPSH